MRADRSRAVAIMWDAERDCEPRINHVSSGADNVGREDAPGSMIVGSYANLMATFFFHAWMQNEEGRCKPMPPGCRPRSRTTAATVPTASASVTVRTDTRRTPDVVEGLRLGG